MALVLSTPFVDVLVIGGGIRWFAAYGVVVAIGLSAAAVAIAVTILLFRLIGPSRTRLVAQILAAIIGAGFVIALQIAAILSYGTLVAVRGSDLSRRRRVCARCRQHRLVAGARGARRRRGDAASVGRRPRSAGCRDGGLLAAVCRHRGARVGQCHAKPSGLPGKSVPHGFAAAGAAAEGIRAAAARSVAGVADPDAAALSGAAGGDAVAKLRRQHAWPSC